MLSSELDGGKINRHDERPVPGSRLDASGSQHPLTDRDDQAAFLRDRNEIGGRDETPAGVVPSQQRLIAGDFQGGAVEERLVRQGQLSLDQRDSKIAFQRAPFPQQVVHPGLAIAPGVPPVTLGPVERQGAARHQCQSRGAIRREQGHADAAADCDHLAIHVIRFGEFGDDPLCQHRCIRRVTSQRLDHGKFIATHTRHRIGVRHHRAEPSSNLDQDRIANPGTPRVVDCLEAIQVYAQQSDAGG